MARIRTIKPEFFTSEDIVRLSPMARLLYIALWCEADREGRMNWKPRTFKIRYLPADDCNVEALCKEIVAAGLVRLYGDGLAFIPSFTKHQHVNPRESVSTFPAPTQAETELTKPTEPAEARVSDASARVSDVQVGREGREGKEGKERKAREDASASRSVSKKQQMPPDFGISDRVRAWAAENKHGNLEQHLAAFRLSCQAKGYAYSDWDAAFMNAIRNNWAKLSPTPQQVAATRKPDRFELANLDYERKYGTPDSVKALVAKFTSLPS